MAEAFLFNWKSKEKLTHVEPILGFWYVANKNVMNQSRGQSRVSDFTSKWIWDTVIARGGRPEWMAQSSGRP